MGSPGNGTPLALAAAGLLAAVGLLRQRGSRASDPKARAQHLRRLLEPGSGASEAERQFARRNLEGMEGAAKAKASAPQERTASVGLRETARGRDVGMFRNVSGKENSFFYTVLEDGVPEGGGYIVNPGEAAREFDGIVEDAIGKGARLVEQRQHVLAFTADTSPNRSYLLVDVDWKRHPALASLSEKIFLLMTLSGRSKWGKLNPWVQGGPFKFHEVWSEALRVMMDMHQLSASRDRAADVRRSRPETLKIVSTYDEDQLWPLMQLDSSESRQTWIAAFHDRNNWVYSREYDLGHDPMNLYVAIEKIQAEMPDRQFSVQVVQSCTVIRAEDKFLADPNAAGPMPSRKLSIRKILSAPVQIYRSKIEQARDESPGHGDEWSEVLRLIDHEGSYDDWFIEAFRRLD